MNIEVTREDEITQVSVDRPHVVMLGAGASLATLIDGDRNGKKLPLMQNFHDHVPIGSTLETAGVEYLNRNFEDVYSELAASNTNDSIRLEIETIVFNYFSSLELPDYPTIYDHLILALRPKDVIATFNWDPLLLQAVRRHPFDRQVPKLLFLHGNVLAGYCAKDSLHGYVDERCPKCSSPLVATPLLYPTAQKYYERVESIQSAWRDLENSLQNAFMVTVFGYGAPKSDVAAMSMIQKAWGDWRSREMEQVELVNVIEEEQLITSWEELIHSHHYKTHPNIYDSWAFNHPRRTGEAWINQYFEAKFIDTNPIPQDASFQELAEWVTPLIEAETNNQI